MVRTTIYTPVFHILSLPVAVLVRRERVYHAFRSVMYTIDHPRNMSIPLRDNVPYRQLGRMSGGFLGHMAFLYPNGLQERSLALVVKCKGKETV